MITKDVDIDRNNNKRCVKNIISENFEVGKKVMQAYNISFHQVKIGLPYKFLGNIR